MPNRPRPAGVARLAALGATHNAREGAARLIDYQTKLGGHGVAVLNADGPVHEVTLKDESIAVEGKLVIARTAGLHYRVRRPVKSLIGYWLSGESVVRVYSGTGRVLMSTTPYWNQRLLAAASR